MISCKKNGSFRSLHKIFPNLSNIKAKHTISVMFEVVWQGVSKYKQRCLKFHKLAKDNFKGSKT